MAKGQPHLIKLVSVGDEKGDGKGHTYYSRRNKKSVERKLEFKKYNPLVRKHTVYKEKKA
jgi:large subunit ribosomal protein L33